MCVRTRPQPTQERGAGRSSRMPEYDLVLAWPTPTDQLTTVTQSLEDRPR